MATRAHTRPGGVRPAAPVERRTVTVDLPAPFAGWTATAYADFSFGDLSALSSGDPERILVSLDRIVIDHNFPAFYAPEQIAETFGDVDQAAVQAFVESLTSAIAKLPNR